MPTKKILDSWLHTLVPYDWSPAELADVLMQRGIETESIDDRRQSLAGFVVGEVLTREAHPNADRLAVTTVSIGGDPLTVVCGAPNVAAGQKIAFAPVGLHIPTAGFTIERRKIRGIVSDGMICSPQELGLGEDHDGILVLPESAEVGTPLADLLGEVIYEIDVTPNRADCLNHLGIAREIAATNSQAITLPDTALHESAETTASAVTIAIDDPDLCARYTARVIRGVRNGPSPAWLQDRLRAMGLRPRNIIVDATSLVLFECGHPLHGFDYDKIAGSRIEVKTATAGTKFVTLDGKEHSLPEGALMICDAEKPVAIAGVMGGENSEISDETTNVLLESAWFNPSSVRRTARILAISTDASYRFERGADIDMTIYAVDRAASLITELGGGEVLAGLVDLYPNVREEQLLELRFARTSETLGLAIEPAIQIGYLERLGFSVAKRDDVGVTVRVPSWRVDVAIEVDLIEEVARMHGYDAIPADARATVSFDLSTDPLGRLIERTRRFFVDNGCSEIVPYYFTDPETAAAYGKPIELQNALGRDFSNLRTSLVPSMAKTIAHNQRHSQNDLRLFEVGRAFREGTPDQGVIPGVVEMDELSVAFTGRAEPSGWGVPSRESDIYDLRAMLERYFATMETSEVTWHPEEKSIWGFGSPALSIHVGGEEVGRIGPFDGPLRTKYDLTESGVIAVIDLGRLVPHTFTSKKYQAPSKYPVVHRDISLLVDRTDTNAALEKTITSSGGSLLTDVRLFDLYQGKGIEPDKKSMSYSLQFTSYEKTLEVETIDAAVTTIVDALTREHGAKLRGSN